MPLPEPQTWSTTPTSQRSILVRSQPDNLALLRSFSELAGALGFRWYLFGAQAAALYGSQRVTLDVDVTVELGDTLIEDLVVELGENGFSPRVADPVDLARTARVLPVSHDDTGMDLDIVIAGSGLEADFMDRARSIDRKVKSS